MDKKSERIDLSAVFFVLPVLLTVLYCITENYIAIALAVISLFVLLAVLPVCHRRENLWAFVVSSLSGMPFNIKLIFIMNDLISLHDFQIAKFIYIALYFFIIYSAEQVILAAIVRLIWRKQYLISMS